MLHDSLSKPAARRLWTERLLLLIPAIALVLGVLCLSIAASNQYYVGYEIGIFPFLVAINGAFNRRRHLVVFDSLLILVNTIGLHRADQPMLEAVMTGGLIMVSAVQYLQMDIRLRTQEQLIRKSSELETVLSAFPARYFWFAHDGTCLKFHIDNLADLAIRPETFLGRKPSDFFPPDQAAALMQTITEVARTGKSQPFSYSFTVDGKTRFFEGYLAVWDANQFILRARDVSPERELEAQLAQSARLFALGEMAGGVAHEINNPLAIIVGRTEQLRTMLEEGEMPHDRVAKIIANIEKTARRIERIVKGLRNLSRDASQDPPQDCALEAVLADTLDLCTEKLRNRGVDLEVEPFPSGLRFTGRSTQVSQVLLNLLYNALDALESAAEKKVRVVANVRAPWLEIRVSDTGPGIPEAIRKKIFQPFFTTKGSGKGTGLGLSISRRIIEDQGGKLLLEPTTSGATFLIQLPLLEGGGTSQGGAD